MAGKAGNPQSKLDDDWEIGILANAKRMGLSFEELNLLGLNDYLVFMNKWVGDKGGKKEAVRQATQADIDFFMG